MIRVENRGAESHEVTLLRLPPGKTVEDVRAWIRNPESPGEYLLMCLVTASDGRSHADHGMIQQIRVG